MSVRFCGNQKPHGVHRYVVEGEKPQRAEYQSKCLGKNAPTKPLEGQKVR